MKSEGRKYLFNDALNTFYLWLYDIQSWSTDWIKNNSVGPP